MLILQNVITKSTRKNDDYSLCGKRVDVKWDRSLVFCFGHFLVTILSPFDVLDHFLPLPPLQQGELFIWSAANGGVTNGGLRGVTRVSGLLSWKSAEIDLSAFFCLFRPFPEGPDSTWKIQKAEEKGLFPQISSDLLKPPSLNSHLRHSKLSYVGWCKSPPNSDPHPPP